jgi:hypothetical protein
MGRVAAQMERKGIPVVQETWNWKHLKSVTEHAFALEGVPTVRMVLTTPDPTLKKVSEFMPQFIDELTRPLNEEEMRSGRRKPASTGRIAMTGTFDQVQEFYKGEPGRFADKTAHCKWTDGLPIVPPTEERVAEMLTGTSHKPDEIIKPRFAFVNPFGTLAAGMSPSGQIATVEKVAINAVMAGCKPEYLPTVLAMTELGACVGYTGTCSGGHMFIVSGPMAREVGVSAGGQMLVPGVQANMTLGRAATLIGLNVAGAIPGVTNMETWGSPIWGTTFADGTNSPWETMNVADGFKPDQSVLYMIYATKLMSACSADVTTLPSLGRQLWVTPDSIVDSLKQSGSAQGAVLLLTPACARAFARRHGFASANQLRNYLWDNVTRTHKDWFSDYFSYLTRGNAKMNPRGSRMLNPDHLELPDDALVPRFNSVGNIKIAVVGEDEWPSWGWFGFHYHFATPIDKWR